MESRAQLVRPVKMGKTERTGRLARMLLWARPGRRVSPGLRVRKARRGEPVQKVNPDRRVIPDRRAIRVRKVNQEAMLRSPDRAIPGNKWESVNVSSATSEASVRWVRSASLARLSPTLRQSARLRALNVDAAPKRISHEAHVWLAKLVPTVKRGRRSAHLVLPEQLRPWAHAGVSRCDADRARALLATVHYCHSSSRQPRRLASERSRRSGFTATAVPTASISGRSVMLSE